MINSQHEKWSLQRPVLRIARAGIGGEGFAQVLNGRDFKMGGEIVTEYLGILRKGDSLILVSDGVTQAGLGNIPGIGWTLEGFVKFANAGIAQGKSLDQVADDTIQRVFELSGEVSADDTTVAVLTARDADVINILTGPPANKNDDVKYVQKFLSSQGKKAICGSTTADIVSRVTKRPIKNYMQLGVLTRSKIAPKIAEKLRQMGKIVTIDKI